MTGHPVSSSLPRFTHRRSAANDLTDLFQQDPILTLIHIPIDVYTVFLQPILRLLIGEDHDEDAAKIPWTNRHGFLNITVTQVECSIICAKHLADRFFRPPAAHFSSLGLDHRVEFGNEDYIAIQVDGEGLNAGQRVLELTSPLAMAGM